MVKIGKGMVVTLLFGGWLAVYGGDADVYERNCVACHKKLPVTLENFFFNYLLKYSSERKVKEALYAFLKHPTKKKALASEELIQRYGLMPATRLNDTDLRKAIDTYWETYKVFGKIK
jgi:hypothetical protein